MKQKPRPFVGVAARTRLTEQNVREIKRVLKRANKMRRAKGKKYLPVGIYHRLAETYGVGFRTIEHISWGERWKWVKV